MAHVPTPVQGGALNAFDRYRAVLVSGFWGQNIGNAFFNVGGKWILEQALGSGSVAFLQDQPGYRTFHDQSKGNPPNDYGLLGRIADVDYIVLQGPMLTTRFHALWAPTFARLRDRGIKVVLLSAGMFKYTPAEVESNLRFLEQYPPHVISTRDRETYEVFKNSAEHTYCGVDSGFAVPHVYGPVRLDTRPYVAFTFDRMPEPRMTPAHAADRGFEFSGSRWAAEFPRLPSWFSARGKASAYLGALTDWRRLGEDFAGLEVVRPEHRFNPHVSWKIYRRPNAIASDEPFTYFTIYANAAATFTDRVHAAVTSIAYGKPAMLFSPTRRARLFDRLGLMSIRQHPVRIESERLRREIDGVVRFLSSHL